MKRAHASLVSGLLLAVAGGAGGEEALSRGTVDAFNALIDPGYAFVTEDSTFVLSFSVDSTAAQFNAYDVEIRFDPAVLQFSVVDEGSLMTASGCSRFFQWDAPNDSTITIAHSLLCLDGELNGPGELSRLTFTPIVDAMPVVTTRVRITSDSDRTFADDGLWVWPGHPTFPRSVTLSDGLVVIHDPAVSVGEADGPQPMLPVHFEPNPMASMGRFVLPEGSMDRIQIDVYSVTGRHVWRWSGTPAGRTIPWQGEDSRGVRVRPGAYFYRVHADDRTESGRIVLLR